MSFTGCVASSCARCVGLFPFHVFNFRRPLQDLCGGSFGDLSGPGSPGTNAISHAHLFPLCRRGGRGAGGLWGSPQPHNWT